MCGDESRERFCSVSVCFFVSSRACAGEDPLFFERGHAWERLRRIDSRRKAAVSTSGFFVIEFYMYVFWCVRAFAED